MSDTQQDAAFAALTAEMEQQAQAAPAPVQPNADDVRWLNELQASRDATGNRNYDDAQFRERLEAARRDVFAGKSIAEIRAATARAARGEPPEQPATPAAPAQGSPGERIAEEIGERFDAGDVIEPAEYGLEVFAELSAGYQIADLMPTGFGIGPNEAAQLKAAKAAGVSERQVRKIVAEIIKQQS